MKFCAIIGDVGLPVAIILVLVPYLNLLLIAWDVNKTDITVYLHSDAKDDKFQGAKNLHVEILEQININQSI